MKLVSALDSFNHHLFMDSYFTNLDIVESLNLLGLQVKGMLRNNSKGIPKENLKKLNKGNVVF